MDEIKKLKSELIEYGKLAGVKNFTPGYSGNLSARWGDKILITSSGSANGYLSEDEIVVMDFEGNLLEGNKKPSSEKMLHVEFYKQRPDVNYIIHVHSPYLKISILPETADSTHSSTLAKIISVPHSAGP